VTEQIPGFPVGWRVTRFDHILKRVERRLIIGDATEYSRVGVRWYGNGAFVRDKVLGADIARKQQWIVRAGDVVYNKLFAWKGAFAVADEIVDGHLVSDKFPTYALDTSKVEPRYLAYYFRTHQLSFQAERFSKGAAAISKLTLNPPQFWDLTIPLPPLKEQKYLVALLGEAELRLAEALRLRREAGAEAVALVTAAIGSRLGALSVSGTVSEVLTEKPRNGWSAPCDNVDGGIPVLSLGAVTGFRYRPTEYKRTSEITDPEGHYWLRPGDLLITRSNTEQLLGHAAIYSGQPAPCIYPDLMMRLKVDPEKADTRFVYYWLRTPDVRACIENAGSGTSSTMKKITQKDVMGLPFPVNITLPEQRDIVQSLDDIVFRLDGARSAQQGAEQDISALMPALLDLAFRGKLGAGAATPPSIAAPAGTPPQRRHLAVQGLR
jgi:type I restriction enzyme S subunit